MLLVQNHGGAAATNFGSPRPSPRADLPRDRRARLLSRCHRPGVAGATCPDALSVFVSCDAARERTYCKTSATSSGVSVRPQAGMAADLPTAGPPSRMAISASASLNDAICARSANDLGVTPNASETLYALKPS